jgi:pimeloyl-ACP methyl ester carboxylesterase
MDLAAPHVKKSTTVRTTRSQRAVRTGVGALGAVAPGLAGRAAARLFLTPPRTPAPAREREALAGADRFAVRVGSATVRGFRLGEGPAVLLVHGWGGRAGQLVAFAQPLAAAGCAVVGFDAPAHGASSGRVASVPEFADAVAAVAAAHGARAAIGHSMGAAAVAFALRRGLALDAAVLVSPPRSPAEFLDRFCAALRLGDGAREAARSRIERRVGARMAELDVVAAAPALATPALVVHDRGDADVPFDDGAAIAHAWPGARLVATSGLGHRRVLRDREVVAEAVAFVVARLQRCACGRLARVAPSSEVPQCAGCLLEHHLRERDARGAG